MNHPHDCPEDCDNCPSIEQGVGAHEVIELEGDTEQDSSKSRQEDGEDSGGGYHPLNKRRKHFAFAKATPPAQQLVVS
jgi:hypothetical protein